MPAAAYTVDQSLVDAYLARVNRFCQNVADLQNTLQELSDQYLGQEQAELLDEQEAYAAMQTEPEMAQEEEQAVTEDDIDLDSLLQGVDLDGGLSM